MNHPIVGLLKAAFVVYVVVLMVITFSVLNLNDNLQEKSAVSNRSVVTVRSCANSTPKPEIIEIREIKEITEIPRFGPGENGIAVKLDGANLSLPELLKQDEKHRFSTFISDLIGLRRRLPDIRPEACKTKTYPDNLPPAAVVIIFRDELASILLRTVYSVLQMSPPELLKEIVLVDDGSKDPLLRLAVRIHAANLEKVRVVRHEKARGLMMARQSGVDATTADYFIIMDGLMEVGRGWLEPLIYRLVQEPKAMLCSHVGSMDGKTFEFKIGSGIYLFPFFDPLNLNQMFAEFKQEFLSSRNNSVEPIPIGTVQGMMIVMKKDFFQALGGFDPGMQVWGSEQMELSIKVWMCGGRVEMVTCSHVAHMYRITPWGAAKPDNDFHSSNKARVIDVWMDPPYSNFINDLLYDKNFTLGDISERKAIRTRNQCKPYQHFVDSVKTFSDVYFPRFAVRMGSLVNHMYGRCLDIATKMPENIKSLIIYVCHKQVASNQYFIHTEDGQIRSDAATVLKAIEVKGQDPVPGIIIQTQHWVYPDTTWDYSQGKMLKNKKTDTCLTARDQDTLEMRNCTGHPNQVWEWRRTGRRKST